MGIVRAFSLSTMAVTLVLGIKSLSVGAGENRILDRLERGETVATKTGLSFMVQTLIAKEPEKVRAALGDFRKLPEVFSGVAYARPYVAKDSRQFVYLKLKGLGDGLGVLMEVKAAPSDAFLNARELVTSAAAYKSRDIGQAADVSADPAALQLRKEIEESGSESHFLGATDGITLEGPLNEVMQLPNTRLVIHLGYSGYYPKAKSSKPGAAGADRKTYLVAKVAFGNQVSRENLGDYRGFGERRLSLATSMGEAVIESLKQKLEALQ